MVMSRNEREYNAFDSRLNILQSRSNRHSIKYVISIDILHQQFTSKHNYNNTLRHKNNHHSGGKKERRHDIAIEMALPLTIANEIRCISHVRPRTSPLADAMRFPKLRQKASVE